VSLDGGDDEVVESNQMTSRSNFPHLCDSTHDQPPVYLSGLVSPSSLI
jgi:hypothetical protein